jgi:hypothetical protein
MGGAQGYAGRGCTAALPRGLHPLTLPGGCTAYRSRAKVLADAENTKDHRVGWSSDGPLGPARLLAGGP